MTDRPDASQVSTTRRDVLKAAGALAAASALPSLAVPHVHAGEDNTIQLALVGCGGRGSGASDNALNQTPSGPIKLVAMADVFQHKLDTSYNALKKQHDALVDVPADRKFVSFDGYKQAMDCLKPGDIVILATPPAFRWVHFKYAIDKGLNVFMEKPVTVDGPTSRRMMQLADEADKKNIKVGVGLMCRHCRARGELAQRIKDGEMGDLILLRAYRQHGPVGTFAVPPRPADKNELMYQIANFHGFLWASGGSYSDFYIHNIDECCWMKDAWPVQAASNGGRHYRGDFIDQNFDTYSTEFTFADGSKLYMEGRTIEGCHDQFASLAHGSKGCAVISQSGHAPSHARICKGQNFDKDQVVWKYGQREPNPYLLEWEDLIQAIREDKPYNEVRRGVQASLVTSMGRMAAHTGQVVTYDQMLNCEHEFAPDVDKLVLDGKAPLLCDASGRYPVPQPGIVTDREY